MAEERPQRLQPLGRTQANQLRQSALSNPQNPKEVSQETIAIVAEVNNLERTMTTRLARLELLLQEIVNELRVTRLDIPKY